MRAAGIALIGAAVVTVVSGLREQQPAKPPRAVFGPVLPPPNKPATKPAGEIKARDRKATVSPALGVTRVFRPPPQQQTIAYALPAPPQIAIHPEFSAGAPSSLPLTASIPRDPDPISFTEPVLARQSTPIVVPPDLRRLMRRDKLITLRLTIDAYGRVVNADSVDGLEKTEKSLWLVYANAVRTWQFEPARRNGLAVPATTILRFRLSP